VKWALAVEAEVAESRSQCGFYLNMLSAMLQVENMREVRVLSERNFDVGKRTLSQLEDVATFVQQEVVRRDEISALLPTLNRLPIECGNMREEVTSQLRESQHSAAQVQEQLLPFKAQSRFYLTVYPHCHRVYRPQTPPTVAQLLTRRIRRSSMLRVLLCALGRWWRWWRWCTGVP
jgi:hypothetical protein